MSMQSSRSTPRMAPIFEGVDGFSVSSVVSGQLQQFRGSYGSFVGFFSSCALTIHRVVDASSLIQLVICRCWCFDNTPDLCFENTQGFASSSCALKIHKTCALKIHKELGIKFSFLWLREEILILVLILIKLKNIFSSIYIVLQTIHLFLT